MRMTLSRLLRDFALFWRLTELRARLLKYRAEARLGMNAGDAAVMAVSVFALLFVVAVVQVDAPADPVIQRDTTALTPPARATGARQQESDCKVKEAPGPTDLVSRCRPWV